MEKWYMAHRSDGENHDDDCCFYLKAFYQAFPGGSDSKETACNARDLGFDPWVGKIPWRRKQQTPPVLLPGEFYGQRSLVGYSPWGPKESDTTEGLTLSL